MEWLTFICANTFGNPTETWNDLVSANPSSIFAYVGELISNKQFHMLLQESDIIQFLIDFTKTNGKNDYLMEELTKCGLKILFSVDALPLFKLLGNEIRDAWIKHFKKEYSGLVDISNELDFIKHNLFTLYNIDVAPNGYVSKILFILIPDNMFTNMMLKNKNSNYEKKELLGILHEKSIDQQYFPKLDKLLEIVNIDDPRLCLTLRAILETENNQNQLQVLRFLKNNVSLDVDEGENDCLYELIRSLPQLLVQLIFCPKQCWYDNDKSPCLSRKTNNWWGYLLPQWRCNSFCSESIHSVQCSRFAMPNETTCLWHKNNPIFFREKGKQKRMQLVRYYESNTRSTDVLPEHYNNATAALVRYPQTHRVVNPMQILAPQSSRKYATKPKGYYIPIIRYQSLYYSKTKKPEKKYCGTFLFYEPESNVYLYLGEKKTLFFASKIHAWYELYQKWKVIKPNVVLKSETNPDDLFLDHVVDNHEILLDYINKYKEKTGCCLMPAQDTWPDLLRYRYFAYFLSTLDFDVNWHNVAIPFFFPSEYAYGYNQGGVGNFDDLDQDICIMARDLGYDNLVLQHEIGSKDCVTEILHTSQDVSSTLFTIDRVVVNLNDFTTNGNIATNYPKIWFPKDNGIIYIDKSENATKIPCDNEHFQRAFYNWDYQFTKPDVGPPDICQPISEFKIEKQDTSIFEKQHFMNVSLSDKEKILKSEPQFEFEEKNV